jgi:superfamily I DNA/RNA helicase
LKKEIVTDGKSEREIFIDQVVAESSSLPRPLNSLDITVTNILGSKGLGADVVFLVGFDQGKFPAKQQVEASEIYQMLVALTRAKKRVYLLNTVGSEMSMFMDGIPEDHRQIIE